MKESSGVQHNWNPEGSGFGKSIGDHPSPSKKLRRRILFLVLGLGIIPSLLTLAAASVYAVRAIRENAEEQARRLVNSQSENIGRSIQGEIEELKAKAEFLRDNSDSPETLRQRWRDEVDSLYLFEGNRLVSLGDGQALSTDELPSPLLRGTGTEVREPFAFEWREQSSGLELWFAAPINHTRWVIERELITDLISTTLSQNAAKSEGMILYSSKTGVLTDYSMKGELAPISNKQVALEKAQGIWYIPDDPGVAYVYSRAGALAQLSEPSGMSSTIFVLQRVDLDNATAPLFYGIWRIVLFFIGFVVVYTFLGTWISSRLVSPILRLRAAFQRLEQGDLDHRVAVRTGDELEDLGNSMNRVAKTLQTTYQTLADKILELNDQTRQLSLTYEIAKAINRSLDLYTMLEAIVTQVRQLVAADQLALLLVSENKQVTVSALRPREAWGFQAGDRFPMEGTFVESILKSGRSDFKIYHIGDKELEWLAKNRMSDQVEKIAVLPLHSNTGPVGILLLGIWGKDGEFSDHERKNLELLAPTLANAVEHARLYQRQSAFAEELEQTVKERTEELARAQQQLVQVEKLTATGELASNVAHEVNNPLSIIKNNIRLIDTQLLRGFDKSTDEEILRHGLHVIDEEIDRIARIVRQLKQISQPVKPNWELFDFNGEVEALVSLFRTTFLQKHLNIDLSLDPKIGKVMLCRDYLKQILINLLRNAYDATPVNGGITIETSRAIGGSDCAVIAVRDTGVGIQPEQLGKIFDPFYTTKKEGQGTGLGLSVSYGLATQMGGKIEASSKPGEGTEMKVFLPHKRDDEGNESDHGGVRQVGNRIIIG